MAHLVLDTKTLLFFFLSFRIRLLFSIADIDTPEAEFENEEGEAEQANEDAQDPSFPIRTAITVTKVIVCLLLTIFYPTNLLLTVAYC